MTQELDQDESIQPSANRDEEASIPLNEEPKTNPDSGQHESTPNSVAFDPFSKVEVESGPVELPLEPGLEKISNPVLTKDAKKPEEPVLEAQVDSEVPDHKGDQEPSAEPIELIGETHEEKEEIHEVEVAENYLLFTKEELVNMLDEYVKAPEVSTVRNKVAALKEAFQTMLTQERNIAKATETEESIAAEPEIHVDPVADKFFALIKKFNRRRIELREKLELEKTGNLKAKSEILTQLKNLIQYEENMQKAFNQFHDLQAKWRAIGPTPQQNVNDLWLTYKLYVDKFYELIRINKELQDLDFKKNLSAKIKICERAEELILEPSINKALNHMQSLQNQFRETGPVPRDNKNEIWERFKAASDKIFERKQQYLGEQKEKYGQFLAEKTALCEKAEAISKETFTKSSEWQEKIKDLLELQAEWKKTGFAGKEDNDKLWHRFKASFDRFFQSKKDFYNKSKEVFNSNLQKKTELCLHAEALMSSTDWKNTSNELKRLQADWKTIGHAGEYQERKIFNRFRKACDGFFENKSRHFASQDQAQDDNYLKKITLIEQIESFAPVSNQFENIEALKNFQRQWMDLGMVPLSKKEEINARYKKSIDQQFSNLRIDDSERNRMRNTQKSENYKSRPASGSPKIDDEKRLLLNKITALKSDVSLWENNIGFFAKSKNADVLKKEFEEKINQAKEEIKSLHEKMELIKKE